MRVPMQKPRRWRTPPFTLPRRKGLLLAFMFGIHDWSMLKYRRVKYEPRTNA